MDRIQKVDIGPSPAQTFVVVDFIAGWPLAGGERTGPSLAVIEVGLLINDAARVVGPSRGNVVSNVALIGSLQFAKLLTTSISSWLPFGDSAKRRRRTALPPKSIWLGALLFLEMAAGDGARVARL